MQHAEIAKCVRQMRGRARLLGLVTVLALTASAVMVLNPPPAAPEETEGPSAYTYWNHGAVGTCQLAKIPDLAEGDTIKAIGPTFSVVTDGCPDDLAVRPDDDNDDDIDELWAVIDPCEPPGTCDAPPPPPNPKAAAGTDGPVSALGAVNSFLVTIDTRTGVRTTIGALGFGSSSGMLAFDEEGDLWYYAVSLDPACPVDVNAAPGAQRQCLYRLDPSTGAATLIAAGPPTSSLSGAVTALSGGGDASCDFVYANVRRSNTPFEEGLSRVDTTSGELTPRHERYDENVNMTALGRDEAGEFWGIGFFPISGPPGFKDFVYRIDPQTGEEEHVEDQLDIDHTADTLFGLEITGLSCDDPPADVPVAAPPVVIEPTFTG